MFICTSSSFVAQLKQIVFVCQAVRMYVYITEKRYKSFSPGITGDDVFKDRPERYMLKFYYASILPTEKRKTTSATLLTSLSCRLFLSASSQLRESANKSNHYILGHPEIIPSLLLSWRGSGMLKEVWRSDRAFFPFQHSHNRSTHKMRRALLMERKWLHSHCLQGARHEGSGLKATIQLTGS